MDEVSVPPPRWRYVVLNAVFGILVALALGYIVWRGFAAESSRQPVPLFGEVSVLECEGRKQPFLLASYADLKALKPGDKIIREKEPAAVVWQVVTRSPRALHLERRSVAMHETQEIALPPKDGTPRYILLRPAPKQ